MGDHGFVVDVRAVHGFGTDFQHDLDVHLSAEKVRTLHQFASTPVFGSRAVSADMQNAAKAYHARLLELYDVMDALLYNGAVMARAAHLIAEGYESSDAVANQEVQSAVNEAKLAVAADSVAVDPVTGRPI